MPSNPINQKKDVKALLRQHLLADSSVTELVGSRIRTEHAQDPDTALTYPLVILDLEFGTGGYQGGWQRWTVDIYCYSDESQAVADTLYDAVYLALQANRLFKPGISARGLAREVERPESGYNDEVRAWWVRGVWTVNTAG